ncbi:signal recognition particle subunit FFH/SRP54 (srp54) [Halanaerobium congolense]|jgi:signal recognition particle subunit SRP54|uniref:Signal recognition particle protein n=1 Tax=Halanaerobium congolense TaxID=54121 RepID=A0A1G6I3J5_9FIRM|nr:signal recognition particle protein [Halanaerobium congolense]KXS48620.1 MAG: signal recognition particle subunit SRP54 [Halanaerobium sp. T82-1]OEG63303.1 MAG: signal recognition particle protein [Halanaerobium sp. MDAL1]PUU93036.1 MAG: signal recognition particle subunit SRP54 [Halanaerobium sp.]PTX17069.1 signal recognition particle subunit FFH/SRP54 (srp54) [Halanaerobium congolense]PXV66016.1 signal recognition particle subunit FFH/SRP54 (srp54) [Halanaerobium congolense]
MIFSSLAEKLQDTFDKLRGKGKLTEKDVKAALKEVKMALLEADVNYKVVKDFISKIEERAVGKEVMESLTPGQHVIKIVNEEMQELMGGSKEDIAISSEPPTIIMMVGLQGSGKTTSAGKLARKLSKDGKNPLLVAADVYRPAAIRQLQVLGERLELPVFSMGEDSNPVDIAKGSINYAASHNCDTIILDTAGRLHIDQEMMEELENIKGTVEPDEILLVVDAMTGQDAVNVAKNFDQRLDIDGIVLTKMDGDARGGAALSIKAITGKPIKFAGTGEKLADLETFHPDRMSSRILGMGDVLSLIEKAEKSIDQEKAKALEEKLRKNEFTLEDFMEQMEQVRNMGPMDEILGMIPGMGGAKQLKNMQVDDKQLDYIEAIISSMTPEERRDPEVINGSRRKRIAQGSGTSIQEVNRLLKQFRQIKKMMKQLNSGKMKKGGGLNLPFFN